MTVACAMISGALLYLVVAAARWPDSSAMFSPDPWSGTSWGVRKIGRLLTRAGKDWLEDKAPRLAAALSYYTAFSLPPLLVLLIGMAGLIFGAEQAQNRMLEQIGTLVGEDSALLLGRPVDEARQTTGTGMAAATG